MWMAAAVGLLGSSILTTELRGSILDARTGLPIPARISIQNLETSQWFFARSADPAGSAVTYDKFSLTNKSIVEKHVTLSAHPFVVELPRGRYSLLIQRGKEYLPLRLQLEAGEAPLDRQFRLTRFIDMAQKGWYSGDTHAHRALEELPNVQLAEDLNIAFPLLDWVRAAFTSPLSQLSNNPQLAAGIRPETITIDKTHLIAPRNTEYEIFTVGAARHTLGAVFVLNHKKRLELGIPPVVPVAEAAHREGALLELDKHNWPWSMAIVPLMKVDLYELSNNHVWETQFGFSNFGEPPASYMGVERDREGMTERGWLDFGFQNYYALLNCGFRLRPTAGTASGVHPVPLGFGRVYVKLKGPFSLSSWLEALNAGRSFVTTGPLMLITLDGNDPGCVLKAHEGDGNYQLQGEVFSALPIQTIEIIVNGETASVECRSRPSETGGYRTTLQHTIQRSGSFWVAARCIEGLPDGRSRFAHTAPFSVVDPSRPVHPRKVEVQYLVERVEKEINRSTGVLPEAVIKEYRNALRVYQDLLPNAR